MKIDKNIIDADFTISDKLIIKYKKGYGFWIIKEVNNKWYACTNSFRINPYGIGFKDQYGFSYKDLKPFLFVSFNEALSFSDKVDDLEYCEFNPRTHEKFYDTILRKGKVEDLLSGIIEDAVISAKKN
jgi:hypothetical protein